MKQFLLVEDDEFKEELITSFLQLRSPGCFIRSARSVSDGVRHIRNREYDLVLLDMSLPSFEIKLGGAQPLSQPTGGIEILLELSFYERTDPIAIITQFPDIEYEGRTIPLKKSKKFLNERLDANIVTVIYFNAQNQVWQQQLRDFVQ